MTTSLQELAALTTVVSDTGDFESIAKYNPRDATTNPSLILAASKDAKYKPLLAQAVKWSKENHNGSLEKATDYLLVSFGKKILDIVPGRVSTEVDARLSFDTEATVAKALDIINLYKSLEVDKERVLVKIASTWEGIKAAEILERDHHVHCNLTLLFSFAQAVACAEAKVTLISPFVGRILDWYKANTKTVYTQENDPGVASVKAIYNYYKKHGYKTIVMGASFRSTGQIIELAGCDYLTISPTLLEELKNSKISITKKLSVEQAIVDGADKVTFDEKSFRWANNEDQMATEKLSDGIRKFAADCVTLENLLRELLKN